MTESFDGMDEGIAALGATTDRLIDAVTGMSQRLNTTEDIQRNLSTSMDKIERQQAAQATQRKINAWLALSLLLDIVLSVAVGLGYFRIDNNADHISEIQTRTSSSVLCPLYQLLKNQADTLPPEAADGNGDGVITPQEQATWDETVRVVVEGYNALDCTPPK